MFKCFEIAKDQYDKLHTCFSGSSAKLVPAGLPEVIEVSNLNLRHLRGRRLTSSWNFSNILLSLPRKHHYLEPDIICVSDCICSTKMKLDTYNQPIIVDFSLASYLPKITFIRNLMTKDLTWKCPLGQAWPVPLT